MPFWFDPPGAPGAPVLLLEDEPLRSGRRRDRRTRPATTPPPSRRRTARAPTRGAARSRRRCPSRRSGSRGTLRLQPGARLARNAVLRGGVKPRSISDGTLDFADERRPRRRRRPSRAGSPSTPRRPRCSAPAARRAARTSSRARRASAATRSATAPSSTRCRSAGGARCGRSPTTATSRRAPYVSPDPFEPYAIAAVELAEEKMVVLGQVVAGRRRRRPRVGQEVELVARHALRGRRRRVPRLEVAAGTSEPMSDATSPSSASGMHPWGKWGRNFVEYGVAAARDALADAGLDWTRRRSSWPAATPSATATPATSPARRSRRPSAGRARAWRAATPPAPRARSAHRASRAPRSWPGSCDVALVVGADTTPKGFFAPVGGDRPDDPDWLRFRLLGATNPTYFALYARRRMELYGATDARLRQGEGEERAPRPRTTRTRATARRSPRTRCWPRRWWPTRCACSRSAPPATAAPPLVLIEHGLRPHGTTSNPVTHRRPSPP